MPKNKKLTLKFGPMGGSSQKDTDVAPAMPDSLSRDSRATSLSPETNIEHLFRKIDCELATMPKSDNISSLFHSLKTELVGVLFESVHRVESRLPAPTKSYAAAASAPIPEKPIPSKELREIQIRRRDLSPQEEMKTPTELLDIIRSRFVQLGLGHILAIRELPSKDLVLVTDTPATKCNALKKTKDWLYVVGDHAAVRPQKYTVMAHGIPVAAFENEKQDEGLTRLHESNPSLRARNASILRFHWRQRALKLKKSYSSLLLDIESAHGANVLIQEGLVFDNEIKDVELFDPSCLITRCYRCQKYGHNAKFCQATERCSLCAAPGHSRLTCPRAESPSQHACVNCTGGHASGSAVCVEQKNQARRARDAVAQKARFFREPNAQPSASPPPVFPSIQMNWTPHAINSTELLSNTKKRKTTTRSPPRNGPEPDSNAYKALATNLSNLTGPKTSPAGPGPSNSNAESSANATPDISMEPESS